VAVAKAVDDDGGAAPGCAGGLDEGAGGKGLSAGLDPVVEMVAPHSQLEVAVAVIRRGARGQPAVTVGGGVRFLADLDQTDVQVQRDQGAQQAAAGLQAQHERGPLVCEQGGQRETKAGQDVGSRHASRPGDGPVSR
jgi:hypothetical protein